MITHKYHILSAVAAVSLVVTACSVKDEEALVLGRVGNISLYGGRERVVCKWNGVPDNVAGLSLSDGERNFDTALERESGTVSFGPVGEGRRTFAVTWLSKNGGSFDGPRIDVDVYGSEYEAGLKNRELLSATYTGQGVEIALNPVCPDGIVGMEFSYTTASGEMRTDRIDSWEDGRTQTVTLPDAGDGPLSYCCLWNPSREAGDIFRSARTLVVPETGASLKDAAQVVDGYRGIWFTIGQSKSEYGDKYSGGLGTYTMKHIPMAVYAPQVDRTYFVYGGCPDTGEAYLQCMIGCYDHRSGMLRKPRVVMDKGISGVSDPHDDPTVQIDKDGYVWVFVAGRGNRRPGVRYRSVRPYDISSFEYVSESIMAYPQVMYSKDKGFFLFFTRYDGVRQLFWQTSEDGVEWSPYRRLASIKEGSEKSSGHYQISNIYGDKLCTAFNRHINGNVDTRTNIYYLQSTDWGQTWTTASGTVVSVPVTERHSACELRDYQSQGRNCYIKDLNFDQNGNPVILYLTSDNHLTGPSGGVRQWHTLHWTGDRWEESLITTSTHCYDSGSIWVEDGLWTVIAPTDPGPQYWGAGGEMVRWTSRDNGVTWTRSLGLTSGSAMNQTYARRPFGAADGFYAFWADGNPDARSVSNLYFCDKEGHTYRMPYRMSREWEKPEPVY